MSTLYTPRNRIIPLGGCRALLELSKMYARVHVGSWDVQKCLLLRGNIFGTAALIARMLQNRSELVRYITNWTEGSALMVL